MRVNSYVGITIEVNWMHSQKQPDGIASREVGRNTLFSTLLSKNTN